MFFKKLFDLWTAKRDARIYKRATQKLIETAESRVRSDGKVVASPKLTLQEKEAIQRHRDRHGI